jgi:hypothetical protein
MKNMMNSKPAIAILSVCFTLMVTSVQAADLVQFSNGNIADADDVNANFNELETRIETISLTPGATGATGADSVVAGPTGPAGADSTVAGPTGPAGADSTVAGPTGPAGAAGTSCTVAQGQGFANISCGGGTIASVSDGTTAIGNTVGDMQYWDGAEWVVVAAPTDTSASFILSFTNGQPSWQPPVVVYYNVGDTGPAGGFVFYVTDGGLHGLEAAPVDQTSSAWGCYEDDVSGAVGTDIGTGAQNTDAIVSSVCDDGSPAALAATGYELNGYTDWFLPSRNELNLMYENLADSDGDGSNSGPADLNNVGGFASDYYWSSSQYGSETAWYIHFDYGDSDDDSDKDGDERVRAVRSF